MKTMDINKARFYKTAKATVSCACFKAGEWVSVKLAHVGEGGVLWFNIDKSERGDLPHTVCYPENHLEQFCL